MFKWMGTLMIGALLVAGTAAAQQGVYKFDIPPQTLDSALRAFAQTSRQQILFDGKLVQDKRNSALVGDYPVAQGLAILLQGTGLSVSRGEHGAFVIATANAPAKRGAAGPRVDGGQGLRLAQVEPRREPEDKKADTDATPEAAKGIPEILVEGSRSLNMDIKRTEDAPQPYVVFEREEIQRSQSLTLEDFLRTRLPMNTASSSNAQSVTPLNNSTINLRGLGYNQTLILVDGRRMAGVHRLGAADNSGILTAAPFQADLNGIPLSAVERIEVLASTAGGIYGGSATGGVVNVILRRDYAGMEVTAAYANTFDTDAANMRLDASAGFSLEGGRTQVILTASRSEANTLAVGDRDFAARSRARQWANNPAAFTTATTPPLGATVNIRSAGGALVLDAAYGGAALNSNITHLPLGYAGPASDNGAALLANAGRYNLDLPDDLNGRKRGLVSAPSMQSASLNVRREFTPRVEAFVELSQFGDHGRTLYTSVPTSALNLPASAPNNPFQQAINVSFPTPGLVFDALGEVATLRANAGVIARLPGQWMGEIDYGWSRARSSHISMSSATYGSAATALNTGLPPPDGRPALNALQEGNTFPLDFTPYLLPSPNSFRRFDSTLKDLTLRVSGPALRLPGGALNLSALIQRREEALPDSATRGIVSATGQSAFTYYNLRSQDIDSVYVEARAPLISALNAIRGVRELDLQISLRRDEYRTTSTEPQGAYVVGDGSPPPVSGQWSSEFASTDYTAGLRYSPAPGIALRASVGTGFLPPSVNQITSGVALWPASTPRLSLGNDPLRGNTPTWVPGLEYELVSGGSPTLRPESSRSVSAGLILTPPVLPGLRVSVDYSRIEKVDEIQSLARQYILDNEALFPGRIRRGPKLVTDPADWAGPAVYIDSTLANIARTELHAYDIQADYTLETARSGSFHWNAVVTWQPQYGNQTLPTAAMLERVGYSNGPLEWRGNAGLTWQRGAFTVAWNGQYYDSQRVYSAQALPLTVTQATARATAILNQGSDRIPRQLYHDLVVAYEFDAAFGFAGGIFAGSEVSFGIQNLFDTSPPIVATTTGDGYSTFGDPRLRRYTLSLRKSFGR